MQFPDHLCQPLGFNIKVLGRADAERLSAFLP